MPDVDTTGCHRENTGHGTPILIEENAPGSILLDVGLAQQINPPQGGLAITLELECDLLREYDTLLEELEPGRTPVEPLPEDCG